MKESLPEHRLAVNEVMFRDANRQVTKNLERLQKAIGKEGHDNLVHNEDTLLHFYCECSNKKCRQRIILHPTHYNELHKNSSQFIVIPGHDLPAIEKVVCEELNVVVVEKFVAPPKKVAKLNRTPVRN